MQVDGQILSENHLRDAKLKNSKFCRISTVIRNTYDCTLTERRIVSFLETCGIWVVSRAQTRPYLGASFLICGKSGERSIQLTD